MAERDDRLAFLDVIEERRMQSDRFAWAVPAVLVASQAFLITIALDGDADPLRRLIASVAALITLGGAFHLFYKQAFAFALYEAVIKRERTRLKLPQVDRNSLLQNAGTLEERFQREWLERRGGELVQTAGGDGYYQPKWLIRRRATRLWFAIFVLIAVLDLGLVSWALVDGARDGWFSSGVESPFNRGDDD